MPNDLSSLTAKLATQLRDTTYAVWTQGEMAELLTLAVDDLWPSVSYRTKDDTTTITIVSGTRLYAIPTTVVDVDRVDVKDASNKYIGPMMDGSWDVTGDTLTGSGWLTVNPSVNDNYAGGKFVLEGYCRYDLVSHFVPDPLVALVLAKARAEAYRRMGGNRAQFTNWQSRNQLQDMSVNELIALVNEAETEAERLRRRHKTLRRPVPGRVG